ILGGPAAHSHAHPHAHAHAAASAGATTALATTPAGDALTAGTSATTATGAAGGPRGTLHGDFEILGDGREIKRLADIVAQGNDQFIGMNFAPGHQVTRGLFCKAHLLVGAEENDVG